MRRTKSSTKLKPAARTLAALAAGAGLAFFFDPRNGKRRRLTLRDRTLGMLRRSLRRSSRTARGTVVSVEALLHRAAHVREQPKPELTDETLVAKIMSEVFRDPELPKGDVNVNVEDGVAVLRGQVERPELIEDLIDRVRKVNGVRDVASLLHVQA